MLANSTSKQNPGTPRGIYNGYERMLKAAARPDCRVTRCSKISYFRLGSGFLALKPLVALSKITD